MLNHGMKEVEIQHLTWTIPVSIVSTRQLLQDSIHIQLEFLHDRLSYLHRSHTLVLRLFDQIVVFGAVRHRFTISGPLNIVYHDNVRENWTASKFCAIA